MKLHDLIDHLIAIEMDGGGDRVVGYLSDTDGFIEVEKVFECKATIAHGPLKVGEEFIHLC
jgi:hypothetical protein